MKICILSMQGVANAGSVLQSYSLKKILTSLGHNVKFIDIEYREEDNKLVKNNKLNFSAEGDKGKNFFAKIKKIDRYFFNRIKIRKLNLQQNKEFSNFLYKVLGVSNENEHFDLCIIGSDEVFNCVADTPWGFTTQLFGEVNQASNIITYAASCGTATYENVPQIVQNRIKKAFTNVRSFSVRDINTRIFVENLTDKPVDIHLDPVIVGNFDDEIKKCNLKDKLPNKYCIVYSYYNRINAKEEIDAIKKFCDKNDMEIISLGAPQSWITNHIVFSPFEILAAFKNASFVVTDTFHGTIFAAKYSKSFMTVVRESNYNKMSALIQQLQIGKHLATDFRQIDSIYKIKKNQKIIDDISEKERKRTIDYLVSNIKNDKLQKE